MKDYPNILNVTAANISTTSGVALPINISDLTSPADILHSNNSVAIAKLLNKRIQEIASFIAYTNSNFDDFFFFICGILVLFMQVGFACLEAGNVSSKNVTNIMLKNFLDSLICAIVFWLTGWALSFGDGNQFLGWTMWASIGLPDTLLSLWFFQYTFASTASTILSGAVAERCSFIAYLLACGLISGVVYPIVVHWCWHTDGWLYKIGFSDFSGSMVIHGLSGTFCLVATIIIGARIGRFKPNARSKVNKAHSTALIGIGAIIILVGFCGFNAGTINHYSHPGDGNICARIARNTIISGAGGALCVLFLGKLGAFKKTSRWPFVFTVNGGIAGLVASCATCNDFTPTESLISGIIAGLLYTCFHHLIILLKIDDPLDSSPIHLCNGVWGVLSLPLLNEGGIIYQPMNKILPALLIQLIGVGSIVAWVALWSVFLFGTLHIFGLFRSSEEEELIGMDASKHGEPAYADHFSTMPKGGKNISESYTPK